MEIFLLIIALQFFSFIFYWKLHKRLGEVEKEEIVILQRKKDMLGIEYHEEVFRLGGGAIAEFLEEEVS